MGAGLPSDKSFFDELAAELADGGLGEAEAFGGVVDADLLFTVNESEECEPLGLKVDIEGLVDLGGLGEHPFAEAFDATSESELFKLIEEIFGHTILHKHLYKCLYKCLLDGSRVKI